MMVTYDGKFGALKSIKGNNIGDRTMHKIVVGKVSEKRWKHAILMFFAV